MDERAEKRFAKTQPAAPAPRMIISNASVIAAIVRRKAPRDWRRECIEHRAVMLDWVDRGKLGGVRSPLAPGHHWNQVTIGSRIAAWPTRYTTSQRARCTA